MNALGKHCGQLVELGFIDGENVDGAAVALNFVFRYLHLS